MAHAFRNYPNKAPYAMRSWRVLRHVGALHHRSPDAALQGPARLRPAVHSVTRPTTVDHADRLGAAARLVAPATSPGRTWGSPHVLRCRAGRCLDHLNVVPEICRVVRA